MNDNQIVMDLDKNIIHLERIFFIVYNLQIFKQYKSVMKYIYFGSIIWIMVKL